MLMLSAAERVHDAVVTDMHVFNNVNVLVLEYDVTEDWRECASVVYDRGSNIVIMKEERVWV
jgi:hypothetical protein